MNRAGTFHVKPPLTAAALASAVPLSEDALERLAAHLDILRHWQRRINLVGAATLDDPWRRHVLDSVQLVRHVSPADTTLADFGSGAGFPGLVVAIADGRTVHLIESDARKCAFLREAARVTEAPVVVHAMRIEALPPLRADVIMARACARLPRLLNYALPHLAPRGRCLFLKGRECDAELTESAKSWMMHVRRTPSLSDPSGSVLQMEAIRRRDDDRSRQS